MIKIPAEQNPFILWCEDRIKKNRNGLIVINGSTGSGKTYSAIGLCKMISERLETNFSVEENVDFSFKGLIKKMELPHNQKPGTCFVFEEVGAVGGGASSREWQSQENKLFFSWLQTSRHLNQILIMTCPCFDNLEAGARKLIHWQMNTKGIDYQNKIAFLKPYKIQVNSRTGKFFFKYLRVKYQGRTLKFQQLSVPYIGEEVANAYEKMKDKFSASLRKKIFAGDEKKKKTKQKKQLTVKKVDNLIKQGVTKSKIAELFGVSRQTVYNFLSECK